MIRQAPRAPRAPHASHAPGAAGPAVLAVLAAALALVFPGVPTLAGESAGGPAVMLVSPASFTLERGEMVSRFEVEVKRGRIAGLPRVPAGWRIKIATADASGRLEAVCESPASTFASSWFKDFLAVSLDTGGEVVLEIAVTKDGEKISRRARFEGATLALRPAPPDGAR